MKERKESASKDAQVLSWTDQCLIDAEEHKKRVGQGRWMGWISVDLGKGPGDNHEWINESVYQETSRRS